MIYGKCLENSDTSCEVNAISGTKIMDDNSSFKACLAASIYTKVFPEPVMPCSSIVPLSMASIVCRAAYWSLVNIFFILFDGAFDVILSGVRRRFFVKPLGKMVCQTVARCVA